MVCSTARNVGDHRLAELALPGGNPVHGREVAARHYQRVDARPVDAAERCLGHAGVHLADGVGIGGAQALRGDHGDAVLRLVVAPARPITSSE
jgi:hypothetical protein